VSDTPRTDAARHDEHDPYMAIAAECSKLERELNAANIEIEEKRKDVVWLATEKAKLENYVMLLEEVGDEMHRTCDAISANKWAKTEEAKP
jgi:hypothetical protein